MLASKCGFLIYIGQSAKYVIKVKCNQYNYLRLTKSDSELNIRESGPYDLPTNMMNTLIL